MKLTDKQLIESGLLGFTLNDFHEVTTIKNRIEQILIIDCPYFKTYDGHKRWVIHKSYYDNEKYELVNYEYFFNNDGLPSYLPLSFLIGSSVTFTIVNKNETELISKKGDTLLLTNHNDTDELVRNPQIFDNNSNNDADKLIKKFAGFFMDYILPNIEEVERIYEKNIGKDFDMSNFTLFDAYNVVQCIIFDNNNCFMIFDSFGELFNALNIDD